MNAESFRKICELKQEIQLLLAERPELRPLQAEIDRLMAGAGSQHNRCVLITEMMKDKVAELSEHLPQLGNSLDSLVVEIKAKMEASDETEKKPD